MLLPKTNLFFYRAFIDTFVISLCLIIALFLSPPLYSVNIDSKALPFFLLLPVIWYFIANSLGLYDEFRAGHYSSELIILFKCIFWQIIIAVITIFFVKETEFSRLFVFYYALSLLLLLSIEKYIIRKTLQKLRKKGKNVRNLLIIGGGVVGKNYFKTINKNLHFGYMPIGFLDDKVLAEFDGLYLGNIDNLENILAEKNIDEVVVTLPNNANKRIDKIVSVCENHPVQVKIIPDYFKYYSPKYNVEMVGSFPIISIREDKINEFNSRFFKRIFDITFSLLLFILVFSWLFPIIGLVIKINSKGSVFFKQVRWRKNNRKFMMYKFRSMGIESTDIDENGKYRQATKDDSRITRIGSFLRKTNLDELPQFINVLKGDMSLVGPRPHPTTLNLESREYVNHYMARHRVKPGITGWAQVNGCRGETNGSNKMQKRVDYDCWYIENWSFLLDIQIIILTVWQMLKGDLNAY